MVMGQARDLASRSARKVVAMAPDRLVDGLRPLAQRVGVAAAPGEWWEARRPPSGRLPSHSDGAWCIVCNWEGERFAGIAHTEHADCPRCGSIARDRFIHWCFLTRTPEPVGARVLETSPRISGHYAERMRRWFDYRASDFDLMSHRADLAIDLQDIDLPDESVDVVLSAHVLEHVPDTGRALRELRRILVRGGRVYLQVPLVYGRTAPPTTPEFHEDNTPVFFNFGWDLTDIARDAGFDADVLVTDAYRDLLLGPAPDHDPSSDGFHLYQLAPHPHPDDLTAVADAAVARRCGFEPAHHFATWELRRPFS